MHGGGSRSSLEVQLKRLISALNYEIMNKNKNEARGVSYVQENARV